MLKYLHIENIAVIEKSDIEFLDGFNVLTGETGAGKSIVIDALNAVLGERTSKNLIRAGAKRALVNAEFSSLNKSAVDALAEFSYFPDDDGNVVIQRVISAEGGGSIKINGQSVTSSVLRSIAPFLVNIHGQHDSQSLLNPDTHFSFIDIIAENEKEQKRYRDEFNRYRNINAELRRLNSLQADKAQKTELLKYQIAELTDADIKQGETAELERKSALYRNYDKTLRSLSAAYIALNGEDGDGAVEAVAAALSQVNTANVPELSETATRLSALHIELSEVRNVIGHFIDGLDYNPEELEQNEKRLSFLHELFSKYGKSEEAAIEYLQTAQTELEGISLSDSRIAELESELEICSENLVKYGKVLSDSRKTAARSFEREVCGVLTFLDMPYVKFKVDFKNGKYTKNGCDIVEFLISSNAGEEPKPLSKIASGGELSRIMLAIKSVLADRDDIDTLIFDEIDTGISGRAAQKVGIQLKKVAANRQVLCVTHLAQIAAKADTHFYIEKNVLGERTYTDIEQLDFDGRKYELARIIGGEPTEQNLKSAEEMLNNAI